MSQEQLTRVTGYLNIGRQEGARPLSGGERLVDGAMAQGFFVPPTVFADVRDDMRIAQEEIFGPVISAIPFTDIEEVIERGNNTQFGLGSGVWTAMSAKRIVWQRPFGLDQYGSIAIRRWIRRCHLAAIK